MLDKILQDLIYRIKGVIEQECGIADEDGNIIACTDEGKIGRRDSNVTELMKNDNAVISLEGYSYKKIYIKNKLEFVLFVNSDQAGIGKYLSLISINIEGIKGAYDEKHDRLSFVKGLITGDAAGRDIPAKAKDFHIAVNVQRIVFLVKTSEARDVHAYEVIQSLFPNKAKDFILLLDSDNIVLIKEIKTAGDYKEVEKTARIIVDTLVAELMVKASIGIGTIVDNLIDIARSYNEAKTALTVGGIFESDKNVLRYDTLGIGRLIYQVSGDACRLFLKEVFKDEGFEAIDAETALTIQKFFENNLNISEASRQL
jgi:carbohydrate diacid regulator